MGYAPATHTVVLTREFIVAGSSRKAIFAAIFGNFAISIVKFVAASMSGSSAMLAEGIHSLVDTGNGGLLLLGIRRSQKPPDEQHPFGHSKELYFWTLIVGILIFGLGGGVSIFEGIEGLKHPHLPGNPAINYIVLALAVLFEGAAWSVALGEFRKSQGQRSFWKAIRRTKDPTSFAVLFEDTAALLGLLVAFLGIFLGQVLGNPYLDGAASIVIGLILCVTALLLVRETKPLLLGESAHPEVVESIQSIVKANPAVVSAVRPLTMHLGPEDILVNLDVQFHPELRAEEVELAVDELEARIRKVHPEVKRIYIEADALGARVKSPRPG